MAGRVHLSCVECEYGAAALVDPNAASLESPAFSLDAGRARPLLVEPRARDCATNAAESVLKSATLTGDAIDRRRRRTSALFHREEAAAPFVDPDAVVLKSPTSSLHARCTRALLDQPCTHDAPIATAEAMLEILARARDLVAAA